MNIATDAENTRIKAGVFEGQRLVDRPVLLTRHHLAAFLATRSFDNAIVSCVGVVAPAIVNLVNAAELNLTWWRALPLPNNIRYAVPHPLGADRIAAVCGAWDLLPQQQCLIIGVGTGIKYKWIDDLGDFFWGPDLEMWLNAIHTFTACLTLVTVNCAIALAGNNSERTVQSGARFEYCQKLTGS